ncbi:MAG: phosphoglycerate mutase [Candidatus Methanomethylophilaceae archaeon]|nr:phosphoglycerate mutase [Candidatus Methanomethylophilaceae archaeon]
MNTLFVLLDGAEDHPVPEFGGMKPLDVAKMPFMASKAPHRAYTTGRGYTHLFLNEFFTGHPPEIARAALEGMGLGMNVKGRTAYRLSPAIIKDGMINWSYHAEEFCDRLIPKVEEHLSFVEKYNPEIRFFLNGRAILTMDCDLVPDLPAPPVPAPFVDVPGDLGKMVMAVAKDLDGITDYPWGCGRFERQYEPFKGLGRMTVFSDSPTPLGICASLGHEIHLIDDIDDRFPLAKDALDKGNVFLHLDEIDEYSHQKDPMKKVRILEHVDRKMEEYFSDVDRIVFFVDHGTSSVTGEHILMNVPFWTSFETSIGQDELIPLKDIVPTILS